MKTFYGSLCILGTILPYWIFLPWLLDNRLDIPRLISEVVNSRISAFAWLDIVVSSVAMIGFILIEGKRLKMNNRWLPIVSNLIVGVSLALPLFLLMRDVHQEDGSP